jgi:hypothetical protein
LEVTSQNVRLADPVIGEETIGRFGVRPILADQRNALSHGAPNLPQQFAESVAKPSISKFAFANFSINPTFRAWGGSQSALCRSIPQCQSHGAPLLANQVLSKESQAILSIQDFANRWPTPSRPSYG